MLDALEKGNVSRQDIEDDLACPPHDLQGSRSVLGMSRRAELAVRRVISAVAASERLQPKCRTPRRHLQLFTARRPYAKSILG